MLATSYALNSTTELGFPEAAERVRAELKAEGFGILCEIDVQATLREKLGVEREPYLILGACNPPLAHQALEAEPDLGTLLPCNVVIYRHEGETSVPSVTPAWVGLALMWPRVSYAAQESVKSCHLQASMSSKGRRDGRVQGCVRVR